MATIHSEKDLSPEQLQEAADLIKQKEGSVDTAVEAASKATGIKAEPPFAERLGAQILGREGLPMTVGRGLVQGVTGLEEAAETAYRKPGEKKPTEQYPGIYELSKLGGVLLGAGAPAVGRKAVQVAPSLARRIAEAVGMGGLYGEAGAVGEAGREKQLTPEQLAKESVVGPVVGAGLGGGLSGALELASRRIKAPLARKLGEVMRSEQTPTGVEAEIAAAAQGIPLTAGEATGKPSVAATEKFFQEYPPARQPLMKTGKKALEREKEIVGGLTETYPEVTGEITKQGEEFQGNLLARQKAFADEKRVKWAEPGKAVPAGAAPMQLSNASAEAQKIKDEMTRQGIDVRESSLVKDLEVFAPKTDPAISRQIATMKKMGYPDNVINQTLQSQGKSISKTPERLWDDAQANRAWLSSKIDATANDPAVQRQYVRVKDAISKDMEDYARKVGGPVWDAFQMASEFHARGNEIWSNPRIQQIIKAEPGSVYEILARGDTKTKDFMDQLQKVMPKADVEKVRGAFLQKIFFPDLPMGAENKVQRFMPNEFVNAFESTEPEAIKSVLGEDVYMSLKQMKDAAAASESSIELAKRPKGKAGYLSARGAIAPVIAGGALATGHPELALATLSGLMLFPNTAARIYMRPSFQKLLKEGVAPQVGSEKMRAVGRRMAAMLSGAAGGEVAERTEEPGQPTQ